MSDSKSSSWLSPAECSTRTGLTIKALRVYERHGLVAPKRTPSGWRGYGPAELNRLNTIRTLKTLGLTLKQIRTLIQGANPPLKQVLDLQIEAARERKREAERAESFATFASKRLEEHNELTVDELCDLIRSFEMSNIPASIQRLLDRHMSAEEQERWQQLPTSRPKALEDMKAYAQAQRDEIFPALERLMAAGADLESPDLQALIDRNNALMTQFGVRERLLASHEANPETFGKALNMGRELMRIAKDDPDQVPERLINSSLLSFFFRAAMASAHCKKIEVLLDRVSELQKDGDLSAADARDLVERFRAVCEQHHLGDPLTYAKWAPTQSAGLNVPQDPRRLAAWRLLAESLRRAP